MRTRIPSQASSDIEMDDVDDSETPAKTPQQKEKKKAKRQVVVEIPPRQNIGSSAKRVLQESPTPAKTSTKRTKISDRGGESESGVGEGTPVQQAKGKAKAKAKQVEENTPAKKTCARREPETTVEVAKEVQQVDLGALDIDEDTPLDPALVPGVEKMVCSLLSRIAARY